MSVINKVNIINIANGIATIKLEGVGFGLQGSNKIKFNSIELTVNSWSDTEIIGTVNESAISDIKRKFEEMEDVSGTLFANANKFLKVNADGSAIIYTELGSASSKNTGVAAGNVPVLNSNGKLENSIIPAIAVTDTFVIANESVMLSLTAEVGDVAVRTDLNKSFILKNTDATILSNWQELLHPNSPVQSVAGKTGNVTLSNTDVGLGNVSNTAQVTSVSGSLPIVSSGGTTPTLSINLATQTTDGSFSKDDKIKLDGISAHANKVEASTTNGNIKVDGNQVNIYTHPASHTKSEISDFTHTHIQSESHNSVDTDSSTTAIHHTIGAGANQAAAGNHNHSSSYSPVGHIHAISEVANLSTSFEPVDSNIMRKNAVQAMSAQLTAVANTNYTTAQVRNITLSTSDPSGGSNGDIWIKYTA